MGRARTVCAPAGTACVTALLVASVAAYNFAPEFARVFHDPRNDSESYFGYSVALRRLRGGSTEIIVGAPRANDYNDSFSSELRPGAVYVCNTEDRRPCFPLLSDSEVQKTSVKSNRQNSGLGSVIVTDDSTEAVVACAPRWKSEKECKNIEYIPSRPSGICYLTFQSKHPATRVSKLYSFTGCKNQTKNLKYYFAFAGVGTSVQTTKNVSELILGAPGFLHWRGGVFRYRFHNLSPIDIDIPCPTCYSIPETSYLGYSVGYGKFTNSKDLSYVSSAPRAAGYKGKILVFNFVKEKNYWIYKIIKEREGTQLGEYFGASLCVADFNNDGLDDLLVGAPQHSLKRNAGDEGIIYVLLSSESGWKDLSKNGIVKGSEYAGARFGTSIALLGDINMDGYFDVAVGAPYENKRQGAIYIYHGNKNGLNPVYSQRIVPSESTFMKGFGSSISRSLDVDGNYMKDIAVGAYKSGHVVLIKAYPVITIFPKFIATPEKIPFATKEFVVKLCFSYIEKYDSFKSGITVVVKLDQHFKRASFNATSAHYSSDYNIILESKQRQCRSWSVFIKNKTEFSRPIEFFMEYKLRTPAPIPTPSASKVFGNKSESFCKNCVILNPANQKRITWNVPYIPDSAPADLYVTANFIHVKSPFIIGTSNVVKFEVILQNTENQAIETQVSITFPMSLLKMIPKSCQQSGSDLTDDILELICNVESPFPRGRKHPINVTLDMGKVPFDLLELNIQVTAKSMSLEKNYTDNEVNLYLPLERIYDLEIHGKSVEYTFVNSEHEMEDEKYGEQEDIKYKFFKHNFQVMNNGPSPAVDIDLYFEIPHIILHGGDSWETLKIVEQVAYLEQQPLSCSPVENFSFEKPKQFSLLNETQFPNNRTYILSCLENTVLCYKIKCSVSLLLPRSSEVKISFALKFKLSEKLGTIMGSKDIILIKTNGYINSPDKRFTEIQSVVWSKPPIQIDLGMIAIGVGIGFIIFCIFVYILIKCGFFTRQDAMEKYFRKKAKIDLQTNGKVPVTTFYSPRGSIMVF